MNWLRRPRLKSAVHSVAVLTVMSLALVSAPNTYVLMDLSPQKMSGSLALAPKDRSRKSKSQPVSACSMCCANIQP